MFRIAFQHKEINKKVEIEVHQGIMKSVASYFLIDIMRKWQNCAFRKHIKLEALKVFQLYLYLRRRKIQTLSLSFVSRCLDWITNSEIKLTFLQYIIYDRLTHFIVWNLSIVQYRKTHIERKDIQNQGNFLNGQISKFVTIGRRSWFQSLGVKRKNGN